MQPVPQTMHLETACGIRHNFRHRRRSGVQPDPPAWQRISLTIDHHPLQPAVLQCDIPYLPGCSFLALLSRTQRIAGHQHCTNNPDCNPSQPVHSRFPAVSR